jgi:O-antigen ligase
MRGGDVDQFVRFLGIREHDPSAQENVQTYVQRTMLAYIGWQIFLDHPIAGAGWQSSTKEIYGDYLDDARREFPDTPAVAFPSPERPYGIQNAYVQALADLGLVGLLALGAVVASGLLVGARAALRGPPLGSGAGLAAVCWLLVVLGVWTGVGLIAGLPVTALLWLALGLAVTAARGLT